MHKAVFEFSPNESESAENCIPLQEGHSLTKVRELEHGWSAGYNINTEQTGIFPSAYIEAANGWDGTVQYDIAGRYVGDIPLKPKRSPGTGIGNEKVIKEIRHSINIDEERGILLEIFFSTEKHIFMYIMSENKPKSGISMFQW